jgi:predicted HicB family RNase H-like nuclease
VRPRGEAVVWVELATRIPKSLHRALKLHCVSTETSVMEFVTKAIEEKLARSSRASAKRRRVKA